MVYCIVNSNPLRVDVIETTLREMGELIMLLSTPA